MSDHRKFAAFVLTHGRPNSVKTIRSLRSSGYSGDIYLILDNEDETVDQYRENFAGLKVITFDKAAIAETFDTADTQSSRKTIVYARNACFQIARDLGLDYFLQLDDDYPRFQHRWVEGEVIKSQHVTNIDAVIEAMLTFLDESNALTVAWSQGGDHIGGVGGHIRKGLLRKAMNSFFCRTDRPINFVGRINEDVNSYVVHGGRGELFFTLMSIQLLQLQTQTNQGGMTEMYLDSGTYVKSFYTVMMAPSCVEIRTMGPVERRFHHMVNWDNAVPKILSDRYRK